jgi:CHRD domain
MRRYRGIGAGLALVASVALVGCMEKSEGMKQNAMRAGKTVTVQLSGAQEVPPVTGAGTGTAVLTLDQASQAVTWKLSWSGLTGDVAAAHFHGPAAPGANAGVVAPIGGAGMQSPSEGVVTLTAAQWADLMAGKDYINIHTAANKGGEIRGQINP